MQSERPEYPETKAARWKAIACFVLAALSPSIAEVTGGQHLGPYLFALFAVAAAYYVLSIETDRLHRRLDAMRDGD